ncbi:hypothetical protein SDRG_15009 [Saprolegnia diclina VS20]|uniref:DUF4419 domain-containing protein n=1 Tax=Saprolegnia diclina (strain VS20) TaxID=1156394 RepID=T0RC77_SAPDV|nr:hypothetical protein SDRG_15009 [Saprolegnia diclina VS20]EQC27207.1 hypothetical protein SDRG_15009 [Saprolegnia diclina VS20]|eukprot:XP_008619394.1 hypothetical protein SDRG_15009 [Saprolegnia diclina VS20]
MCQCTFELTAVVTFAVASVERTRCQGVAVDDDSPVTFLPEFKKGGCKTIVQAGKLGPVVASESGFVRGVMEAYNNHHDLVLRPDDVWLAILTQFGLYVVANADELRHLLVTHDGQKELTIRSNASLWTADFGAFATQWVDLMDDHVVDPSLKHWLLPSFSTTTDHDVIVASVVLMATMKKYFSYKCGFLCGIPHVTLLGTVDDWKAIRNRLDKLAVYGPRMQEWTTLLAPILDQFVASATGDVDVAFWNSICSHHHAGSGTDYISGWLSVFCVFNDKGEWQGDKRTLYEVRIKPDVDLCALKPGDFFSEEVTLPYPLVDSDCIPPGYLTVDVTLDDNGTERKALMFAGHMGYGIGDDKASIAPRASWAIVLKDGEAAPPTDDELFITKILEQFKVASAANFNPEGDAS